MQHLCPLDANTAELLRMRLRRDLNTMNPALMYASVCGVDLAHVHHFHRINNRVMNFERSHMNCL